MLLGNLDSRGVIRRHSCSWLMSLGVRQVGGSYKMLSAKGWFPKNDKRLFLSENLDFWRIKYSNLHSQTNERDLLVLLNNP